MHLELILTCSLAVYFSFGFFSIFYLCFTSQKSKSSLLKLDFIISFFLLFIFISFAVFSNFFTSRNLLSSLFITQILQNFLIILAFLSPILLIFTYFLQQNVILGWIDDAFYRNRIKDAAKLTFLIILSIFSFFILSDFLFEYFLIGVNFRMNFAEKLASFLIGFCVLLSYFYAGNFLIKGLILQQILLMKKAIYMEFECGIFKENDINEEIGVNSDELQGMIEKYSMTGKKLAKKEKRKMSELISKQNLLIHRRKLTDQFVTKKARILNFIAKILYIAINTIKIILAVLFIFSLGVAILRNWYPEEVFFDENPIESLVEFIVKNVKGRFFSSFLANILSVILIKSLVISYVLYHTKENFLSENEAKFAFLEEKEKEIRGVEKEMNEVKKYFNLISMIFFTVWLISFIMPKYNLFIPDENCDLRLWKQENFVLLRKKCETTILGEIYLLIMQRKEIKIGIAMLNFMFLGRMAINFGYGLVVDRKKDDIKVI